MNEIKPMIKHSIWVVEIKFRDTSWMTTVGVGLNRDDARIKAKEWRQRNNCISRVRQYGYVATK